MEDKGLQDIKPYFEKQWGYISTTFSYRFNAAETIKRCPSLLYPLLTATV